MKIVYLDMDGPIAEFEAGIGRPIGHPLRGVWDHSPDAMYKPGFFRNLEPVEGALKAVNELLGMQGIDVFIATKHITDKAFFSATEKLDWLHQYFPSLVEKSFLTSCKGHLNGDYLIDDHKDKWEPLFKGKFIHFDLLKPKESWSDIVTYFRQYQ